MSRIEGTHVAGVLAVVLALLLPNAATAQTSRTIYDAHGRVQSRKWEVQEDLSRGTNTPSNISLRHTLRDLASYQQDFYRYIDDAKAVSFKDIGNKLDSSSCYENRRGFCPQKIAWIHHLLANDFFEQAKTVLDPHEKIRHLELVLQHSAEAIKYEHEGRRGFVQCTDTGVLQQKARQQINSMSGSDAR